MSKSTSERHATQYRTGIIAIVWVHDSVKLQTGSLVKLGVCQTGIAQMHTWSTKESTDLECAWEAPSFHERFKPDTGSSWARIFRQVASTEASRV